MEPMIKPNPTIKEESRAFEFMALNVFTAKGQICALALFLF